MTALLQKHPAARSRWQRFSCWRLPDIARRRHPLLSLRLLSLLQKRRNQQSKEALSAIFSPLRFRSGFFCDLRSEGLKREP